MKKHGKHRRYTEEDILAEAREYLKDGVGLVDAAKTLHMPFSTLSWHLAYPLRYIDFALWEEVRIKAYKSKRACAERMNRAKRGGAND